MINNMDKATIDRIRKYYEFFDRKALISEQPIKLIFEILFASKDSVLVSDTRMIRAIAKLRRLERINIGTAVSKSSLQLLALCDAFSLLQKKGVPVFFYNRIGKMKTGDYYRTSEERRMTSGLDFPKMYENHEQYADDLKEVFGDLYSPAYIEEIGHIPQVVQIGDCYCHEDCSGELVNVRQGKRVVKDSPKSYTRTIHVYGRCGAFGYAVEDADSLPSLLQAELLHRGYCDVRVINHGLWGGSDKYLDHNFIRDSLAMQLGDIVLFYRKHYEKELQKKFEKIGVYYKDLTKEWHETRGDSVTFFNQPGHMNAEGYLLTAKLIMDDLIQKEFLKPRSDSKDTIVRTDSLKQYLKQAENPQFLKEIKEYTDQILRDYPSKGKVSCGAIVMNCNPFTKGHRYLIEIAAAEVDRLYIFVVQEDSSFFKFADRFEMVKKGTEDLPNVAVVPSGRFIISAFTFPEYFMKDYVKEKDFDVSKDVETFCKYIAPALQIKMRFVGEEPFDPVTQNYNDTMASILPMYGLVLKTVPRLAIDPDHIINATKVRELLHRNSFDEMRAYVPDSTIEIIRKYTTG